jgi:glycine/D-amino acid oxidase-like deaminating enzyme
VAKTRLDEAPGENFGCDETRWEGEIHPALVKRVPAFQRLKLAERWAGLYEMTPDHNPVLGPHPARKGLLLANGFSGHGFMMAPATGKVLSEVIRLGRCETFDIHPFRMSRFEEDDLAWDEAMI